MPAVLPSERIGTVLAEKYRIDKLVGQGGMAVVFGATHRWTNRPVALKLLNHDISRHPDVVRRFLAEARSAAGLGHPNVVDVLDMGADADGTTFLVLELLNGEPSCARLSSGEVHCWGFGPLGDGSPFMNPTPVSVTGLTDAVEISVGGGICARRAAGTVVCWGGIPPGDGSAGGNVTPIAAMGIADAAEVSVGPSHVCVRRSGGTVVCWGANTYGQLGDGTMGPPPDRVVPAPVVGLSDAIAISASYQATCAVRAGGTAVCWGYNEHGQIGDGTVGNWRTTPVPVMGLTDATDVRVGSQHTCALRSGGGVVCWGYNDVGQLGASTTSVGMVLTPRAVSGITDAVELRTARNSVCVRRRGGGVVCWGENMYGQVGDGTIVNPRDVPTDVMSLADAIGISVGTFHACAARSTGGAACWGFNNYGQVGDGTTGIPRLRPVPVMGLP